MRVVIVILIISAILACGFAVIKDEDTLLIQKQKDVWEILKYILNPIYNKEHARIAETYNLKEHAHHYKNDAFKYFDHFHHDRFLKRGEIFSVFNKEHVKQVEVLFKLFYYAQDYETFHHTAIWARYHFSEGLFLYTYCVAIVHRPDTQGLVLPPVHEIYPHYFFNAEVIQQAYQLKMGHSVGLENKHTDNHHDNVEHIIYSNYSGHYLNLEPEQSLSYYLEDVGLNAFYFYFNLYYPYWLNSEEYHLEHHNRGEHLFFIFKQLFAKYHAERISHGLGEIAFFDWDLPFKTGYYPSLLYPNGLPFPERTHFANLKEYIHHYGQRRCCKSNYGYGNTYVQVYEQRIRDAIDSGLVIGRGGNKHHIYSQEGMNILGDIIQGNSESPNYQYYGSFLHMARRLLGYSKESLDYHKLVPSALEHYSTSLRDPAFYQIAKKVLLFFEQYHQNLPAYRYEHLYHQGFNIERVEVEPLVTYYDDFYSDITNGLYVTPQEYAKDFFRVKVHQYRLNHNNFSMKVHIKSEKNAVVAVKVFMGPKYDEYGSILDLGDVQDRMFEIDHFVYDVKAGTNCIRRNSADFHFFSKDRTSYYEAYKHIMQGKLFVELNAENNQLQHVFPLRFKLPRGSEDGTYFQLYIIVYPFVPHKYYGDRHHSNFFKRIHVDNYPLGYPFDRPVEHENVYHVPNAHVEVVKVYHQVNRHLHQKHHEEHQYVGHEMSHDDQHVFQKVDQHDADHKNSHYNVEHKTLHTDERVLQNVDKLGVTHKDSHDDNRMNVNHQTIHNDDHFSHNGDHNNYRQYHYQHQSNDDIVQQEVPHKEDETIRNDDHFSQKGDHSNYRQYHYQHQSKDDTVQHEVPHKVEEATHNDDRFSQKGDHNNYRQYHYQHQSKDDIVQHEVPQKVEETTHNDDRFSQKGDQNNYRQYHYQHQSKDDIVQHEVPHKVEEAVRNDDHFSQKGDHNNYRQYHYQHQSKDDNVQHQVPHKVEDRMDQGVQGQVYRKIICKHNVNQIQDKTTKINTNSGFTNRHIFQDVNVHKYPQSEALNLQHIPPIYAPNYQNYYHSGDKIPYVFENHHNDDQHSTINYLKDHSLLEIPDKTYHGFQYNRAEDGHHHGSYQHHYSSEKQD